MWRYINGFDRNNQIVPGLIIVSGETTRVLGNVLTEGTQLEPRLIECLEKRPEGEEALTGGGGWQPFMRKFVLPAEVVTWRKAQIAKNPKLAGKKAAEFLPYVRFKSGHIITCTPSGWNITETEALFNSLLVKGEVERRREVMGQLDAVAFITKDNYKAHITVPAVWKDMGGAAVVQHFLVANGTPLYQTMDTDINGPLKKGLKKLQGQQLVEAMTERMAQLNLPQELSREQLMTYVPKPEERIQVPQVTRGQTIVNLLVTLSAMSHSYEGAGFARNGQAAQADGS